MGSVIIGTNRFDKCRILISVRERPLLQVSSAPLRISLAIPHDVPSKEYFEIVDNELKPERSPIGSRPRIIPSEKNVSVFLDNVLLLSATLIEDEAVHVKIDLRRLGILIYDDHEGLHIGKNIMANNSFANCMTAIALGS